jgi:hypothetical protein
MLLACCLVMLCKLLPLCVQVAARNANDLAGPVSAPKGPLNVTKLTDKVGVTQNL